MRLAVVLALALGVSMTSVHAQEATELQVRWNTETAVVGFGSSQTFELITRHPSGLTIEPLRIEDRPDLVGFLIDEQREDSSAGEVVLRANIELQVLSPDTFVLPGLQRTAVDATGRSVTATAQPLSLEVRSSLPANERTEAGPGPIERLSPPASVPTPWFRRLQELALFLGTALLVATLGRLFLVYGGRLRRGTRLIRTAREQLQELSPEDESRRVLGDGSRILRDYFDRRHGTNTLGAPTGRVLDSVPGPLAETDVARRLDELLQRADAVKFPREPAAEDLAAWLRDADRFLTDDDQLEQGARRAAREELRS